MFARDQFRIAATLVTLARVGPHNDDFSAYLDVCLSMATKAATEPSDVLAIRRFAYRFADNTGTVWIARASRATSRAKTGS